MSTDDDTNKLSSNGNTNSNNKKKDPLLEYKRVSCVFVDSIFNATKNTSTGKDPLNTNNVVYKDQNDSESSESCLETPKKYVASDRPGTKPPKTKTSKKTNNKYNSTEKAAKNKKVKTLNSSSSVKNVNSSLTTNSKTSAKNPKKTNRTYKNIHTAINEKYKAKQESEKEKKIYQEKVRLLENRISALKKHENEMNRKKHCNEIRQKYLNKKKKEKNDFKQQLLSYDIDQRNALDTKRKEIKERKKQLDQEMKQSMEKTKNSKVKNYKKLLYDRKIGLNIINENNQNFEKYGKGNVNKIKKEREKTKKNEMMKQKKHGRSMDNYYVESCENNKHETDKLKDKIKKLEKMEVEYLNSINQTRQGFMRNNSMGGNYQKKDITPIKKLDLDEQIKGIEGRHKNKNIQKKHNKNSMCKELTYRNDEGDGERVIKVEKKIELNNK